MVHTWGRGVPGLVKPHGGMVLAWVGRRLVGTCMPVNVRVWDGACMHCMSETMSAGVVHSWAGASAGWRVHAWGGACHGWYMPGVVGA